MSDETLLEFPCDFPIKMMGRDSGDFEAVVRELVENHTGPLPDARVQSTQSRKGNFVSVTVIVTAQSREQLDAIYRDVSAHDDVLMAL